MYNAYTYPMYYNFDVQSVVSVIGFCASVIFCWFLTNSESRSRVHSLLSIVLILNGLTHLLRAVFWEFDLPLVNSAVQILLVIQPVIGAVFIETVSKKRFHYLAKVFLIVMTLGLFPFAVQSNYNTQKIYLMSLVSFHVITFLFYVVNLQSSLRTTKNIKEKNVRSCLLISMYFMFILLGIDWAYKFGYANFRLYPVSLSVFIYYLSSIMYSPGETNWSRVSSKLLSLVLISMVISFSSMFFVSTSFLAILKIALVSFTVLCSVYAIYNQLHFESEPFFEKSKKAFDWNNKDLTRKKFLSYINERPEFHHVSLVTEEFVKKHACERMYELSELRFEVFSRYKASKAIEMKKMSFEKKHSYEALVHVLDLTDSDYIVSVPYTKDFVCIKYIALAFPELYSDLLHGIAQKLSVYKLLGGGNGNA